MKHLIPTLILIAMALLWGVQRIATEQLEAEVARLRDDQHELNRLRREHERLRQLQATASELAALQRDAAELTRLQDELAAREGRGDRATDKSFLSAWTPAAQWENRGNADPTSAVETTLWAAAGGDVTALQNLLQLDDSSRTRARELFERLPESSRALYSSPAHFVAALTIKAIPLGGAKLVCQQQTDPAEANIWVFLRDSRTPSPAPATASLNTPPMQSEAIPANSAYLNLHRGADGWRLLVPATAVDKLVREQLNAH